MAGLKHQPERAIRRLGAQVSRTAPSPEPPVTPCLLGARWSSPRSESSPKPESSSVGLPDRQFRSDGDQAVGGGHEPSRPSSRAACQLVRPLRFEFDGGGPETEIDRGNGTLLGLSELVRQKCPRGILGVTERHPPEVEPWVTTEHRAHQNAPVSFSTM